MELLYTLKSYFYPIASSQKLEDSAQTLFLTSFHVEEVIIIIQIRSLPLLMIDMMYPPYRMVSSDDHK
jgi:hypothetical protein